MGTFLPPGFTLAQIINGTHVQDEGWLNAARMHRAVYVPILSLDEVKEMMRNSLDFILAFHSNTSLRNIAIAQNGCKRGRSPVNVGKILVGKLGRTRPLVHTSAFERPPKAASNEKEDTR